MSVMDELMVEFVFTIVSVKSSILDREPVSRVVNLLLEAEAAVDETADEAGDSTPAIRIVDAFLVPKFHYDSVKKIFFEYVFLALWFAINCLIDLLKASLNFTFFFI